MRELRRALPHLALEVVEGATHRGERGIPRRAEFLTALRAFLVSQRQNRLLPPRRVNQEPGRATRLVGLKGDAKRQFRDEKVQEAFRPEAQFRESPVGWQLYAVSGTRPSRAMTNASAAECIPAGVAVEDR